MLREFSKGTQRFAVRTPLDPEGTNEAKIQFTGKAEIQNFFGSAMSDSITGATIECIARDVTPSFCRSPKPQRSATASEYLDRFYSDIYTGQLSIVLKHDSAVSSPRKPEQKSQESEKRPPVFDFKNVVEDSVQRIKKLYSRMINAHYHVMEKIVRIPEDLPPHTELSTVDPDSVQSHETGWKDWDKPFEIGMFGALKGLVVFNLASVTRLSNSAFLAAAAAYLSEGVKCQYNMTGKSIMCRPWYGSYCIRFNLRTWDWELAWVKYKGSGKAERKLVELNRADRVMRHQDVLYTGPAQLFGPFVKMDDFLSDYRKGFIPPEKDIHQPVRLEKGIFG